MDKSIIYIDSERQASIGMRKSLYSYHTDLSFTDDGEVNVTCESPPSAEPGSSLSLLSIRKGLEPGSRTVLNRNEEEKGSIRTEVCTDHADSDIKDKETKFVKNIETAEQLSEVKLILKKQNLGSDLIRSSEFEFGNKTSVIGQKNDDVKSEDNGVVSHQDFSVCDKSASKLVQDTSNVELDVPNLSRESNDFSDEEDIIVDVEGITDEIIESECDIKNLCAVKKEIIESDVTQESSVENLKNSDIKTEEIEQNVPNSDLSPIDYGERGKESENQLDVCDRTRRSNSPLKTNYEEDLNYKHGKIKTEDSTIDSGLSESQSTDLSYVDPSRDSSADNLTEEKYIYEDSVFPSLSVEEYKRKHNIGSRASTENVTTYRESAFLFSSPDSFYSQNSSPVKSPSKSPDKSPSKSPEKQKQYDSGIDLDVSVPINKTAVVHMGRRVSLEGHSVTVKEKSASKKMSRKKSNSEDIVIPCRRVRREASLNASAMVNILFEKEKPLPKLPRSLKKKIGDTKKLWPEFSVEQDSKCSKKSSVSKNEASKSSQNAPKSDKVSESKKKKEVKAKTLNKEVEKKRLQKLKAILKKKREMKRIQKAKKKEKGKVGVKPGKKGKNVKDIKSKKRKLSDKSVEVKVKKPRTDTRRAARTHAEVTPKKRRNSGSKCASCLQPLSGSQNSSSSYWSTQQGEENKSTNNPEPEEKDLSSINNPYNLPRIQQMDQGPLPMMQHNNGGLPRMQQIETPSYVLPHIANLNYCHQCAPHASSMISAPCQAYALGGVSPMGSMTMMPYQTFGGAYSLPYQTTPPTLSHCACPTCYQTGVYYPPTSSLIPHQSLSHDPCLQSHDPCLHPMGVANCQMRDNDYEDEIIDVGEAEKVPRPQRTRIPTEKEKERRLSSEKKTKNSSESDFEKELTIQIPHSFTKVLKTGSKSEKNLKRPKSLGFKDASSTESKKLKSPSLKTKKSPSASAKSPNLLSSKSPSLKSPKSPSLKSPRSPGLKSPKSPGLKSPKSPGLKSPKLSSFKAQKSPSLKVPKSSGLKSPKSPKLKSPLPSPSLKVKQSNEKGGKSVKISDPKKSSVGHSIKGEEKKVKYNRTISRHGWSLHGASEKRKFMSQSLGYNIERECYPEIRHIDGDIIQVRDCVLLRSGPKETDIPYVAKVTAFWEHPHDGEVMMSLLWFYHPEHTEGGRKPSHAQSELFASKHRDENSVACIDDKGYVLTYNEYCRYKAERRRIIQNLPSRPNVVPNLESGYFRTNKLPPYNVDDHNVFMCRQVYDFKLRRILKNPTGRFQVHSHPIEPNYPAAKHIIFDPPFKKTPAITLGMDLLDAEHNHNLRTYVTSSQLSRHGFLLKLHRFGPRNTQWGIGVRWMACPAA
ncbi:hypothetical protein FSP39_022218 [Pinctada imbricata]|uniref:BAH domain-containing protein n=1 Tax=Pinctada imbricata TaxID=66713 RepID=A0AA88XXY7_PINIB|nr:hypothetical protein FSP39_022218 [Pinctada imbricata]